MQQIVRDQLDRRDANPVDDFALLQIARLELALDLIGAVESFQRLKGVNAKRFVSQGEMRLGQKRGRGTPQKVAQKRT